MEEKNSEFKNCSLQKSKKKKDILKKICIVWYLVLSLAFNFINWGSEIQPYCFQDNRLETSASIQEVKLLFYTQHISGNFDTCDL